MGGEGREEDAEAGHDPVGDEVGREGGEDDDPSPAAVGGRGERDEEGIAGTRREMARLLLLLVPILLLRVRKRFYL